MKLETFFEKFELFADAPNAVAKMRELVLHLAVHGNLVDQSPNDEPAQELLWKSRAEMSKQMALGNAKKEKPAEPVGEAEVSFSLPAGWTWGRLVDAGQFINGLAFKPSDWGNVGRPIIRIQNLSGRNPNFHRTKGTYDHSVLVRDGDILVSWSATLDAYVWRGEEGVLNQHIFRVLPAPMADRGYLYWLLKWVIRQLAESDHAHGLVMSHINRGPFLAHPIPVPPLAEQKRIVAKVNKLMDLCGRLEAQQQEREKRNAALARASLARFADAPTPANLNLLFRPACHIAPDDLRKSVLALAVQGRLVPPDSNDEPAGRSFPKLASVAIETEDDGFPAHWLRVPLGKAGEWRGGGTPSKARADFWKGNIPWVSPKDMKVLHISDAQDHISKAAVEGSSVSMIPPGSLLMVVRGMILARAFPVALTTTEVTINQDMKALLPFESSTKDYLLVALRAFEPDILAAIEHSSHGTCKLRTEFVRSFVIPIPPLAEQRRIVDKVNELMTLVDLLETQLVAARAGSVQLLDTVVNELLQPKAAIIPFPKARRDRASDRAAIGCYTLRAMQSNSSFARTALAKTLYCSEAFIGLEFGGHYVREAAGPLDKWIYDFERLAEREGWFSTTSQSTAKGNEVTKYQLKPPLQAEADKALAVLGDRRQEFDRLLGLFGQMNTEEIEVVTTLFAVWNDALLEGKKADDDWIVRDMRENWHEKKQRFSVERLLKALKWMRDHQFVPKGMGPKTVYQKPLFN